MSMYLENVYLCSPNISYLYTYTTKTTTLFSDKLHNSEITSPFLDIKQTQA